MLERLLHEVLLCAPYAVELGPPRKIRLETSGSGTFAQRAAEAVNRERGGVELLFVHGDGDGDPERARRERVQPVIDSIRQLVGADQVWCVPVVPERATEAWMLASPETLAKVLRANRSAQELGLPARPQDVERELDPKALLRSTIAQARSRTRRRRHTPIPYDPLAREVPLSTLRHVPAFSRLESDLRNGLQQASVLSGQGAQP
jgi:hypothetical protein